MQLESSVTLFDDDKVESRFAELQITADGITSEVSHKVGNDEVISRIRQSAEDVKIQASKIEIDGVINAINNDTSTTINGGKITTGTLSASAVDATSGTFSSALIPNLSADKITTGTISINRIPSAAKNDTYITDISGTGIFVSPANQSPTELAPGNSIKINGDGMDVFNGGDSVAFYGDSARIGKVGASHIEMDYHSLQLKDSDSPSHTYFWVSDLRDENNEYECTEEFIGTGYTKRFTLSYSAKRDKELSVTVSDGSGGEAYLDSSNARWLRFETAPTKGSTITVSYTTNSYFTKAYTLGIRKNNSVIGPLSTCFGSDNIASGSRSLAEGWNTEATGAMSHSEGYGSKATGLDSHAEGESTTASGHYSHAEGDNSIASGMRSHAEGSSTASGEYAHSEGNETVAKGECSHAQNLGTIAEKSYQTAIGKYNKKDNETTQSRQKAFIIGNGTSDGQRNDAMTVDWLGNEVIAGTLTQSSDRRLKTHVSYLGEDAVDFIKKLKPAHFIKDEENHVGFYAQDVAEADKWGCMTGEMNGYMTLGYTELIAPLVSYCQRLESRIIQLESKLKGE